MLSSVSPTTEPTPLAERVDPSSGPATNPTPPMVANATE